MPLTIKQQDVDYHTFTLQVKVADAELLTSWQRKSKEYKQRHQLTAHRESDTMARLMKFRNNLQAPTPASTAAKQDSAPGKPTASLPLLMGCSGILLGSMPTVTVKTVGWLKACHLKPARFMTLQVARSQPPSCCDCDTL